MVNFQGNGGAKYGKIWTFGQCHLANCKLFCNLELNRCELSNIWISAHLNGKICPNMVNIDLKAFFHHLVASGLRYWGRTNAHWLFKLPIGHNTKVHKMPKYGNNGFLMLFKALNADFCPVLQIWMSIAGLADYVVFTNCLGYFGAGGGLIGRFSVEFYLVWYQVNPIDDAFQDIPHVWPWLHSQGHSNHLKSELDICEV